MTLVDISGTVPGSAKFTSAVKGPCLKKPIVPASVRHCIVRVGVVFVTVELVNVVKVAYLHVEQRLTNGQGDLSMQLVATNGCIKNNRRISTARQQQRKRTRKDQGLTLWEQWVGVIADRDNRTN